MVMCRSRRFIKEHLGDIVNKLFDLFRNGVKVLLLYISKKHDHEKQKGAVKKRSKRASSSQPFGLSGSYVKKC